MTSIHISQGTGVSSELQTNNLNVLNWSHYIAVKFELVCPEVSSEHAEWSGTCAFFFFSSRRRHTRCLSDWSSDVCSSDLIGHGTVDAVGVLLNALLKDPDSVDRPVADLVDQNYVLIPPDLPVSRLAAIFTEGKVALVQEDGTITAVVTKIDLIDHVAAVMR